MARRATRRRPFEDAPSAPLLDRAIPVSHDVRRYRLRMARGDLIAGVTVAALALPAAMAYAELAGISPVHGLYALLLPAVAYAVLGSSRQLSLGPTAPLSALTGAAVVGMVAAGSPAAAELAALLALLVAGCFALAVVLRLGWLADYFSRPVLIGYIHGVAVVLVISQLGKLLGLSISAPDSLGQLREIVTEIGDASGATILVSVVALAILLPAARLVPRFPALLLVVVGSIVASSALDLESHGVATVGTIPAGLPGLSLPTPPLGDVVTLLPAALGLFFVGFADEILTVRSFARRHGDTIGVSQELRAMAASNAAAGLTQGYAVGASGSRTAVNDAAGARTQIAGAIAAGVVALILLFLTGPLADLPKAVLGAAIVTAAIELVDVEAWRSLAATDRVELTIAAVTAVGVVFAGVLEAVTFAVALTMVDAVRRSARPGDAVLGYDPTLGRWANVEESPDARIEPGVVVYRLETRLFFANAGYVTGRIRAAVRGAETPTRWVVLDCEAVSTIDSTGMDALASLTGELRDEGITFVLGRVRADLRRRIREAGLLDQLGEDNVHPTVTSAVLSCREAGPGREG